MTMTLRQRAEEWGNWVFRWRSYIPIAFSVISVVALKHTIRCRHPIALEHSWLALCLLVAMVGQAMRWATVGHVPKGTSGRNTKAQKATRLNTRGMYSIVRNPLYIGNHLTLAGIMMVFESWQILLAASAAFAATYLLVIFAEEEYLTRRFARQFLLYASRVPCLLPHPWKWVRPDLPWSWRMVLRREHDSAYGVILSFAAAAHYAQYSSAGNPIPTNGWVVLLAVSTALWLSIKYVKRGTALLTWRPAGAEEGNPIERPSQRDPHYAEGPILRAGAERHGPGTSGGNAGGE